VRLRQGSYKTESTQAKSSGELACFSRRSLCSGNWLTSTKLFKTWCNSCTVRQLKVFRAAQ
jgi:hypothetical protein